MESPDLPKEHESGAASPGRSPSRDILRKHKRPPKSKSRKKLWIALAVLSVVAVAVVLATTLSLLLGNGSGSGAGSGLGGGNSDQKKPHWPGWSGVKNLVVFGDSMTSVAFDLNEDLPSRSNPIGNPEFPGLTSAIGANWVGYLTGTYNDSFIGTIDLAGGGATVDRAIYDSKFPLMRSFQDQVGNWTQLFTPSSADDTLYAVYFGLNDVRGAYFEARNALGEVVAKYVDLLGDLYQAGARNFLLLNLEPLERAPWLGQNGSAVSEVGGYIRGFNRNLTQALEEFSDDNPDAAVFEFDTYKLINRIMDDPCSMDVTCPIKETTSICPAYINERTDPYLDSPDCAYPLDKYFWINGLHCIFRVHDAMAKSIVEYLNDSS